MKNKGFTLLEILIVVSVLAILIGIIVPRIKGFQDEANIIKAKAELRTLQVAVESYAINHSNLPPDVLSTMVGVTPSIISAVPTDPLTSAAYDYHTTGAYYVISSSSDGTVGVSAITSGAVVDKAANDFCVTNGSGC